MVDPSAVLQDPLTIVAIGVGIAVMVGVGLALLKTKKKKVDYSKDIEDLKRSISYKPRYQTSYKPRGYRPKVQYRPTRYKPVIYYKPTYKPSEPKKEEYPPYVVQQMERFDIAPMVKAPEAMEKQPEYQPQVYQVEYVPEQVQYVPVQEQPPVDYINNMEQPQPYKKPYEKKTYEKKQYGKKDYKN